MTSKSIVSRNSKVARLALLVLVSLALPMSALAEPRVVMTRVEGKNTKKIYVQLKQIVKDEFRWISATKYRKRAARIGAETRNAKNIRKVAVALGADAVILADLERVKAKRYVLTLSVRTAATGKETGRIDIKLSSRSLKTSHKKQIAKQLREIIAEIKNPPAQGDEEIVEGASDGDDDDDDDDGVVEGDDDDDDDDGTGKGDDDDDADSGKGASADQLARSRAFVGAIGLSVARRKLTFSSANIPEDPDGYRGFPFGGLHVNAEIYPGAIDQEATGAIRDLGIAVYYVQMLFINSTGNDPDPVDLPTAQTGFGAAAIYRINVGDEPSKPTVKLALGYNRQKFTIDDTGTSDAFNLDVPDVRYTYYDVGGDVRFPVNEKAAINLAARFLAVTKAGNISAASQYGRGTITGADGSASLDYMVTPSVFIRVGGRATYIAFDFEGVGDLSDRDGNGDIDVGGATDLYLYGFGQVGFVY